MKILFQVDMLDNCIDVMRVLPAESSYTEAGKSFSLPFALNILAFVGINLFKI